MQDPGDKCNLVLEIEPRVRLKPGDSIGYADNPAGGHRDDGVPRTRSSPATSTCPARSVTRSKPGAVVVLTQSKRNLTIIRTDARRGHWSPARRTIGDYIFLKADGVSLGTDRGLDDRAEHPVVLAHRSP